MKKNILSVITFVFTVLNTYSQIQGDGGQIKSNHSLLAQTLLKKYVFPTPNIKKLKAEDQINDEKGLGPWRFGYNHETQINFNNAGNWTVLENGDKIWLLAIYCETAQTVNLTFENTEIPIGNELFIYNPEKTFVLGRFTQKHIYDGQLATELIPGETVFVEYYVPKVNQYNLGNLSIEKVTHGYRSVEEYVEKAFGSSGSCHKNVNCPDGVDYEKQKRSVVMLVSGSNGFCTGALINNTNNDGKPYVLTANHCYSSSHPSWIFRFNWESNDCSNPTIEPSYSSLSGAVLRARKLTTDFCLVEITGGLESGTIPSYYNAYFSGWDRTGDNPSSTFGIHHPRGDIKKISFDDDFSQPTQSTIGSVTSEPKGVWRVQWDRNTTTEMVSSGSPLFNQNRRIIGQLWGGQASCSNPSGYDYYGRISSSWNPLGSDSTNQLKHWLDPNNLATPIIDGYDPASSIANDASLIMLKNVKGTLCNDTVSPKFTIVNTGQNTMTTVQISYGFDGVENLSYTWTGSLGFLQLEEISLPASVLPYGSHTFSATIQTVNGNIDEAQHNNSVNSSFFVMTNPFTIQLELNLDCYARETSWELKNQIGDVVYESPVYVNTDEGTHLYDFCLSKNCYTFTIKDAYSDGMSGCSSGNGSFKIKDISGNVLGELLPENANFGASYAVNFCLDDASLISENFQYHIFPNPTKGIINWGIDNVKKVNVTDLNGKLLISKQIENQEKNINIEGFENGIYLIEVYLINGEVFQRKFVLMK